MESEVPDSVEWEVMNPTYSEFLNFSKLIKTIETNNQSFALVGVHSHILFRTCVFEKYCSNILKILSNWDNCV